MPPRKQGQSQRGKKPAAVRPAEPAEVKEPRIQITPVPIQGCNRDPSGPSSIRILKNISFSTYTSIKTIEDNIKKNLYEEAINKYIKLYIDNPPVTEKKRLLLPNEYYIGEDAALSTVAKAAADHINEIRAMIDLSKVPINQAAITRKDASLVWNTLLSDELTHSVTEEQEKKRGKATPTNTNLPLLNNIKALIGNIAFVKAIMDSAFLGETVCISIMY